MDFQKMFLGIKPKKALKYLKKAFPKYDHSCAPKSYRKKNIKRSSFCDDFDATYTVTHLFATSYKNTFHSTINFNRDRYVKSEKNGKTKYYNWVYYVTITCQLDALPMSNYTQTQAKIRELYPKFKFSFTKNDVRIYYGRTVDKLKDVDKVIQEFDNLWKTNKDNLFKSFNYIHDEIHK